MIFFSSIPPFLAPSSFPIPVPKTSNSTTMFASMKTLPLRSASLALLAITAGTVHAASLAYDDFNYTAGTVINNSSSANGGDGWQGPWSGNSSLVTVVGSATTLTYNDGALTYGGGNSMSVSGGNSQNAAARAFSATTLKDGSDVYFSFLIRIVDTANPNKTGVVDAGSFLSVSLLDSGFQPASDNGIIFAGSSFGARVGNINSTVSTSLQYGTTYLVVGRFSGWDSGSQTYQQTSVWLNPTHEDFVETSFGSKVAGANYASISSTTTLGSDGYRGITLRTHEIGTTVYLIDALQIGTTWNDVVLSTIPEPSSAASVFGFAALVAAQRRRR